MGGSFVCSCDTGQESAVHSGEKVDIIEDKDMKKCLRWGCFLVLCSILMTGCTSSGKLDEGNIACVIALEQVPAEFDAFGDDIGEMLDIEVFLSNEVKERTYTVHLNEENGFRQEAMLNPGFYQVRWCTESPSFIHMKAETRQAVLEVGADKANRLDVYIANPEELAENVQWMKASPEILGEGMFSRRVQWKGEMIAIEDIADYVDFQYEQPVGAYAQAGIANLEEGIGLIVLNETDHELPWRECAVQSVTFSSTNVILAGGAMVGMPLEEIVHRERGCLGTPDALDGSILLGAGIEQIRAAYLDKTSGDKITVATSTSGAYVMKITYEFAVFE